MTKAGTIRKLLLAVSLGALFPISANAAMVQIWQSGGSLTNIAQADALIALNAPTSVTEYNGLIDFDDLGDGTRGGSALNFPWPGGVTSNFAARITGSIDLLAPASWDIFLNHDDGARLTVNGVQVFEFAGLTDNRWGGGTVALGAGANFVEIVFFEHFGGASLEFYGGPIGAARLSGLRTVPEPGVLALVGLGLAGLALGRRRKQ